jgi:hypothetical protein
MSAGLPKGVAGGLVGGAVASAQSIIEASATLIVPQDQVQILAALAGRSEGLNGTNSMIEATPIASSPIEPQ